jgi:hypothetical protein
MPLTMITTMTCELAGFHQILVRWIRWVCTESRTGCSSVSVQFSHKLQADHNHDVLLIFFVSLVLSIVFPLIPPPYLEPQRHMTLMRRTFILSRLDIKMRSCSGSLTQRTLRGCARAGSSLRPKRSISLPMTVNLLCAKCYTLP